MNGGGRGIKKYVIVEKCYCLVRDGLIISTNLQVIVADQCKWFKFVRHARQLANHMRPTWPDAHTADDGILKKISSLGSELQGQWRKAYDK